MIIGGVIVIITQVLNAVTSWIPTVTVLPLGMDDALVTAIGYFRSFMAIFPPMTVIFTAFLWYLGFRTTILVLKWLRILHATA